MGTLAENVMNGAQDAQNQQGHTIGDAVNAYHIAATAEHARQELDMEKQKNDMAKGNWVASQISNIGQAAGNPAAQKVLVDAFGRQAPQVIPGFDPQITTLLKDPDIARHHAFVAAQVLSRGGVQNQEQADALMDMTGSAEKFAQKAGEIGEQRSKIEAAQTGTVAVRRDMLEETKNQHAGQAGEEFEKAPIIAASKANSNSLTRSQNILENPSLPVTSKDLNLGYNDYINAVAAGGAATEGKISRELPDTWIQDLNELQQKAGVNADLRKTAAGKALIDQLKGRITEVKGALNQAAGDQALNIHNSYSTSTNEKVREVAKQKLQQYNPQAFRQIYGGPQKTNPGGMPSGGAAAPTAQAPAPTLDQFAHKTDDEVKAAYQQWQAQKAQQAGGSF